MSQIKIIINKAQSNLNLKLYPTILRGKSNNIFISKIIQKIKCLKYN